MPTLRTPDVSRPGDRAGASLAGASLGGASPAGRPPRPVVGFNHPDDVLKDPFLDPAAKRAVLSEWASDANAVPSCPTLRRPPACEDAVPVSEILAALRRLDD